jgi:CRISPR system Cascade subunit CasD
MIGSGYKNTPWEKLLSPKTLEEKPSNAGPSKITYRDYLQNKKFAVIVEAPLSLLELFSEGLKNPVFSIYFGRKNCVPTDLVFRGIFDNEDQAFETIKVISEEKNLIENFRVIDGNFEGDSLSINDVPITFGTIKQYRERMITIQKKE